MLKAIFNVMLYEDPELTMEKGNMLKPGDKIKIEKMFKTCAKISTNVYDGAKFYISFEQLANGFEK